MKRLFLKSSHWVTDLKVNEVSHTQHTSSLDRMRAPGLMGGWLGAYIIISAKNPSELSQKPERMGQSLCSLLLASCCCWRAVCRSSEGHGGAGGSCLILEKRQRQHGAMQRFARCSRHGTQHLCPCTSARAAPDLLTPLSTLDASLVLRHGKARGALESALISSAVLALQGPARTTLSQRHQKRIRL